MPGRFEEEDLKWLEPLEFVRDPVKIRSLWSEPHRLWFKDENDDSWHMCYYLARACTTPVPAGARFRTCP